ncbi:MAG: hypothetical protein JXN59_12810, partial [Anaerolineae bacterium]|nr:hypothetical protein [Anaerolineae bacterium]
MTIHDEAARRRAIRMQRGVLWLSKHWLRLVLLFFGMYVGLPFAAPILMQAGAEGPARVVYTLYKPMCHQYAFRSWFLFGEQPAYPREAAGVQGLTAFEVYAGQDPTFAGIPDLTAWSADLQILSRQFVG